MKSFLDSIMPMVGILALLGWFVVAVSEDLAAGWVRLLAAGSCLVIGYLLSRSINRSNTSR